MTTTTTTPAGRLRTAAINIDCPRPGCGGGVEGNDGSFTLDQINFPSDLKPGQTVHCGECGTRFRVPAAAFRQLGLRR